MRVWIDRGYLIQGQVLEHGGRDYHVPLVFQLFDADSGDPSTGSYRGEASFDGRRLIIGDPQYQSNLSEYVAERQATSESWDYYQGFKAALDDKREAIEGKFPKTMRADDTRRQYYANSTRWWEGYRDAWREKREMKSPAKDLKSNRVEVRDAAGVSRARPRSLAAAHRMTRRANMAGSRVARSTDPALWTKRRVFGVAGGPDEVVLTDEGRSRAFSVGARVRSGKPSEALESLAAMGGEGYISERVGARLHLTALGRFDQVAWGYLREKGYVESIWSEPGVHEEGVRLTELGRQMVQRGHEERASLLERCRIAADANVGR